MEYIPVREAARKFGISERRVQQLCNNGMISSATMLSGVWLIPADTKKPTKHSPAPVQANITLSDFCKRLSISVATGRNWIKLNKITPQSVCGARQFFSEEYLKTVKCMLENENTPALKSRRNKKYISGREIYKSYVDENSFALSSVKETIQRLSLLKIDVSAAIVSALVTECAIQLICDRLGLKQNCNCLSKYLQKELQLNEYNHLIDSLLVDKEQMPEIIRMYPSLFLVHYVYEETQDTLGLLYISLQNRRNRKAIGAYYTPTAVVRQLCSKVFSDKDAASGKTVLDPCCGTGNFLLQLPKGMPVENLYGNDIDETSVKIARINVSLKYAATDKDMLISHFTVKDYLSQNFENKFDYIIGNPPWGYEYTEEEKNRLVHQYKAVSGLTVESYDLFIEQSLSAVAKGGTVAFVLPEAVLNVKAHTPIRELLANNCDITSLCFLGNIFEGVQCPSIICQFKKTGKPMCSIGMQVRESKRNYTISSKRHISPQLFNFSATDAEYEILQKMQHLPNVQYLKNNAVFALGIVTGNNKQYISTEKTETNEIIVKGTDICKYRIKPTDSRITYGNPNIFQQVAPTEIYRAPEKLLYRFIGGQLIFAYDDKQILSLNSCNILIPKIEKLNMKYILALLNSRVAQFYFEKQFNSLKILRSHIEQIPLPVADFDTQQAIVNFVNELICNSGTDTFKDTYNLLDRKIADIYGLTDADYAAVCETATNL